MQMPELDADFEISTNNLEAEYEINEGQHFDCSFEIYAAGTTFSSITGNPYDNEALSDVLNQKANTSTVESLSETVDSNYNTLDGKIDTHIADKTNPHEVTKTQVGLGNVDNTSDLNKPISTATQTALNNKQDIINDLSQIRSNASNGQSAYNTIQTYGDIVTYDASNFATNLQGQKADTALQPNDDISELNNDAGYITSADVPTVNNSTITFQKNTITVGDINLNQPNNETINFNIPTTASDVNALPDTTTINDLTTTAQQNALNSGATSTNIGQITTNANDIADIKDLIPTQATTTNQLADKSFVNSSIATNTANFIGTFQSVAELEAYSGTLTNNDYAFVETTDSAGNTLFDRYKYTTATTPASWQYEYELNNSSFTSNQWASINSGITSNDVTLIGTALQPNDNVSSLTNDAGYITSSSLPTVNNGTLTIQQNGTDVQVFTANQSSNVTANITVPTDTGDLTNGAGFITGITSGDVTTALGYTPYDNSNPNGYTSNVGTVTSVNNVSPVSGNVTLSIPTDTSDLTNGAGYITGIGSSDVINALGYTPYNSTNPNGYTSNVGTVTSVNNTLPDANGNVTISIVGGANTDLSNLTATGEAHFQAPISDLATIRSGAALGATSVQPSDITDVVRQETTDTLYCWKIAPSGVYSVYFTSSIPSVGDCALSSTGSTTFLNENNEQRTGVVSAVNSDTSISIKVSGGGGYINAGFDKYPAGDISSFRQTLTDNNSNTLNITQVDGQWVGKYLLVTSATSVASREHDLSSYLPNDNYKYEVFIRTTLHNDAASAMSVGTVPSPYTNRTDDDNNICTYQYIMANSRYSYVCAILPVGTDRKIYSQIGGAAPDSANVVLHGYRRIGTNN